MFEKLLVIAPGMIRTLMRASRFGAHQGTVGDRLSDVKHVLEFQGGGQLCVECQTVVRQLDLAESLFQFPKLSAAFLQQTFVSIDTGPNFHLMGHFRSKPGDGFLSTFRPKELFPDSFLFRFGLGLDFLSRYPVMLGTETNRCPRRPPRRSLRSGFQRRRYRGAPPPG